MSFYVSASLLPVFVLCLVFIFVAGAEKIGTVLSLKLAGAFAAAVAVTIPWTIRDYHALHGLVFMRSNLGLELFLGNSDGAATTVKQNLRNGHLLAYHPLISEIEARRVLAIGEIEYNRQKRADAVSWVWQHRTDFVRLTLLRIFDFWGGEPLDYSTAIPNLALSFAAIAGWVLLWRTHRTAAYLCACVFIAYPLIYYVAQASPRYALTIHPLVALVAAFAIQNAWHARSRYREYARGARGRSEFVSKIGRVRDQALALPTKLPRIFRHTGTDE